MNNYNYWERYADEALTDAREFMARERLTRHGGSLEAGELPGWLQVGLVLVGIGLLVLAL
jgi:hypothetical protein